MDLHLNHSVLNKENHIVVSGSKSETNRLLLLQALYPEISIVNASDSDDSDTMLDALSGVKDIIDVHHAGTAMRFLTAYFAVSPEHSVTLTGSHRMKERPVKILVDALRQLGARINYLENEGYPPLRIEGQDISKSKVTLKADVSSQYITALMLVAGKLKNGLEITLEGEITSLPYLNMTLGLLNKVGITAKKEGNVISVYPVYNLPQVSIVVESDWSSASYFYSLVALSQEGTQISLSFYNKESLQGDSALAEIYAHLGVATTFEHNKIILRKVNFTTDVLKLNLNDTPDITQTIAVTCFGLGIGCKLTGLHTLKIKETDRLEALKIELAKLGADVSVTEDSLLLNPGPNINADIEIDTYNDHRMAMSFAPLALKVPVVIKNADVVSKSYPAFWSHLNSIGICFESL